MNKKKFDEQLLQLLTKSRVNGRLLPEWFAFVLKQLETLADQRQRIDHPRHRGDAREGDIRQVIARLFPPALTMLKGFALNFNLSVSKEQDVLVCDSSTAIRLLDAGDSCYVPIESCLASVEVKSNLTTPELRRIVLSCVNLKKLLSGGSSPRDCERRRTAELCYAVFAYSSDMTLEDVAENLNGLLENVPKPYRPNLVYVLGQGLLVPSTNKMMELSHRQMLCGGSFSLVRGLRTNFVPQAESYAFLWFLASILDHCLQERITRMPPQLMEYVTRPVTEQLRFEEWLKETKPDEYERLLAKVASETGDGGDR